MIKRVPMELSNKDIKEQLQREKPHLKIIDTERIINRKNLRTTVTVVHPKGRDFPD